MEKEKRGAQRVLIHRIQGDSSEIEITDEFFWNPWMSSTQNWNNKMIGNYSRLRNVMD